MSMLRFLHPEYKGMTTESIVERLTSFSLMVIERNDGYKRRIFSNFDSIIRALSDRKESVLVPKAPGQTSLEHFRRTISANWKQHRHDSNMHPSAKARLIQSVSVTHEIEGKPLLLKQMFHTCSKQFYFS